LTYSHTTQLPDGGFAGEPPALAQSGTVTLSFFSNGDGGLRSVLAAGTFDVVLQTSDGGMVPFGGTFNIDCH
jgi:hypothetical protein